MSEENIHRTGGDGKITALSGNLQVKRRAHVFIRSWHKIWLQILSFSSYLVNSFAQPRWWEYAWEKRNKQKLRKLQAGRETGLAKSCIFSCTSFVLRTSGRRALRNDANITNCSITLIQTSEAKLIYLDECSSYLNYNDITAWLKASWWLTQWCVLSGLG